MGASRIIAMSNGALLCARAFQWHGVALKFPARSRSGVRIDDGMVIFAMPEARVRVEAWGSSCLLWAQGDEALDPSSSAERLRHCQLAMRRGSAEGFLLGKGSTPVGRSELLALRVVGVGGEYWAKWGFVARAEPPAAERARAAEAQVH